MKCAYCGYELPEGTHFCSECGKDLTDPALQVEESAPIAEPAAEAPVIEAPIAQESAPAAAEESTAAPQPDPAPAAPAVPMMESAASPATKVYHGVLDKKPEKHSRWATIGTWGWFGILLLLSIPIVNLIFLLCWSFGNTKKQVKKSFARATLILMLLSAIVTVVCTILAHQYMHVILDWAIAG